MGALRAGAHRVACRDSGGVRLACVLFGGWYAVAAAVLLVVVWVILFLSWSVSARERR